MRPRLSILVMVTVVFLLGFFIGRLSNSPAATYRTDSPSPAKLALPAGLAVVGFLDQVDGKPEIPVTAGSDFHISGWVRLRRSAGSLGRNGNSDRQSAPGQDRHAGASPRRRLGLWPSRFCEERLESRSLHQEPGCRLSPDHRPGFLHQRPGRRHTGIPTDRQGSIVPAKPKRAVAPILAADPPETPKPFAFRTGLLILSLAVILPYRPGSGRVRSLFPPKLWSSTRHGREARPEPAAWEFNMPNRETTPLSIGPGAPP